MEHYEIVEQALIFIEDRLDQPLSLNYVAQASHMSKFYFHRLFSAIMGCSLNHYVLSRRLNASLSLIQAGHLSMTDIAYGLGFGTPSSFTRAFNRQYGTTPSSMNTSQSPLLPVPIPTIVRRPIKNIHGDVVADFTLMEMTPLRLSGIVFEVDLATDYETTIRSHTNLLIQEIGRSFRGPCYVVYSNCQPDSTRFNVICGVPLDIQIEKPFFFTVDVPQLFCAKFKYSGDLLEIGNVLKSDYARFLKVSRQETGDSHIELIQHFEDIHDLGSTYHIFAPIKKLPIDTDEE
ncbi:AraC family transcriptional regulator [Paenibacillus shirakamiensis]|uniref:AraC family transcriptional regulator n=1 Tax=Paenibacillus shirakamiensis TaxID=1265935 RepID=A0ABS4JKN6_9BACL|nr:AraC family transcriptional regulator [Paenibacillus shirakamiensis]MBP2002282.1 AraC family transcriptional regulator [Paenibacillus shirakamiensis]